MITDIFANRYPTLDLSKVPPQFFVQLFNLVNEYDQGIHRAFERIEDYEYSSWSNEHIRLIAQALRKVSNELGLKTLDKPEYIDPDWVSKDERTFLNYPFDPNVPPIQKLSYFEVLLRDIETHLESEIAFIETKIPEYEDSSALIQSRSKAEKTNYYDDGKAKLDKILPLLKAKKEALAMIRDEVPKRLRQHGIPLVYHNGFFQKITDPLIEKHIDEPFWKLLADPKYKNVEKDMQEAIHRLDTGDIDPAFYAAKALESTIKIVCDDKGLTKGTEKGAGDYINLLNAKQNGPIITNDERDELIAMFRMRNAHAHGPGSAEAPQLTIEMARRYINVSMAWICSLVQR